MNTSTGSDVCSRFFAVVVFITLATLTVSGIAWAAIVSGVSTTASSSRERITQLVLNRPQAAAGDLLLASIAIKGGSLADVTVPTGWNQITRTDNDTDIALISYWKVVSGAEPSTYTWAIAGQTQAEGSITPYSGIDASNPIDTFSTNTGSGSLATVPSITTSIGNEEVIDVFAVDVGRNNNAGSYFATPKGTTEKYDVSNTPFGPSLATFDATQATVGSTGGASSKMSVSKQRNWAAQQIALRLLSPTSTLTNGLVSYWKMDGNSLDSVGANNGSGTYVTYSTANGKIKQGLSLNGSSSYVALPGPTAFSPTNTPFAISAWVKTTSSDEGVFVNYQYNNGACVWANCGWGLIVKSSGQAALFARDASGSNYETDSSVLVNDGKWHLLVGQWDLGNTNQLQLYVDGVAVASPNTVGGIFYGTPYPTIGASQYNDSTEFMYFNGSLDEIGFWSRALTPVEISQIYNDGIGLQYPF